MRCPSCAHENREGSKFCNQCSAPMPLRCPSCKAENRGDAKFCDACREPLTGQNPDFESSQTDSSSETRENKATREARHKEAEGERRHLTVMFCDLVDSTIIFGQLDPEDEREVVQAYQKVCAQAVSRFEGHTANYIGDGIMALFGYPKAHEDDAIRAAHTGLEIVAAMTKRVHNRIDK